MAKNIDFSISLADGCDYLAIIIILFACLQKRGKQNRIMMRPPPPQPSRPNQSAMDRLATLHRRASTTMRPIIVSGPTIETPTKLTMSQPDRHNSETIPHGCTTI